MTARLVAMVGDASLARSEFLSRSRDYRDLICSLGKAKMGGQRRFPRGAFTVFCPVAWLCSTLFPTTLAEVKVTLNSQPHVRHLSDRLPMAHRRCHSTSQILKSMVTF
ncbi:hypothetical protein L209DRAFT_79199 [Thermothelomyces heterothallicus CBS 203.75]